MFKDPQQPSTHTNQTSRPDSLHNLPHKRITRHNSSTTTRNNPASTRNIARINARFSKQQNILNELVQSRRKDGSLKYNTNPTHDQDRFFVNKIHPNQRKQSLEYETPSEIKKREDFERYATPVEYKKHLQSLQTQDNPITQKSARQELRLLDPDRLYASSSNINSVYPGVDWFEGPSLEPTIPFPLDHNQTTKLYLHQSLPQFTPRVGSGTFTDLQLGYLVKNYISTHGGELSSGIDIGQFNEKINRSAVKSDLLPQDHPFNNLGNTNLRFTQLEQNKSQSWGMIAVEDLPKGTIIVKIPSSLAIRDGTPLHILNAKRIPPTERKWLNDLMTVMTIMKLAIGQIDDLIDARDVLSFGLHLALLRIVGDRTQYKPIIDAMPLEYPTLDAMLSRDSLYRTYHSDVESAVDYFERYSEYIIACPIHKILTLEENQWLIDARPNLMTYFDDKITIFDALFTLTKHELKFTTEKDLFLLLKWGLFSAQTRSIEDALPHPEFTGYGEELSVNRYRAVVPMFDYFNHSDSPNCERLVQYFPPLEDENKKATPTIQPSSPNHNSSMSDPNTSRHNHHQNNQFHGPKNLPQKSYLSQAPELDENETIIGLNYRPIFADPPPLTNNSPIHSQPSNSTETRLTLHSPKRTNTIHSNRGEPIYNPSFDSESFDNKNDGEIDSNTYKEAQVNKRHAQIYEYESTPENFQFIEDLIVTNRDIKKGEELSIPYYPLLDYELHDIKDDEAENYIKSFQSNFTAPLNKAFNHSLFRNPTARGESYSGTYPDVSNSLTIPFQHGFVPKFNPNNSIQLNTFPYPLVLEYTPSWYYLSRSLPRTWVPGAKTHPIEFSKIPPAELPILAASPHIHWTRHDAPFQFMIPAPYPTLGFKPRDLLELVPKYGEVMEMIGGSRPWNDRTQQHEPLHSFLTLSWRGPSPYLEALTRIYAVPGFYAPEMEENSTLSLLQSGKFIQDLIVKRTMNVLKTVEENVREQNKIHQRQELSPNDWFQGFASVIDDENESVKNFLIYLQLQDYLIKHPFPLRHIHRGYLNSLYAKDYDSAMFGQDVYNDSALAVHASQVLETVLGLDVIDSPYLIESPWERASKPHVNLGEPDPDSYGLEQIDIQRLLHRTSLPYTQFDDVELINPHAHNLFKRFYLGGTDISPQVKRLIKSGHLEKPQLLDDPESLSPELAQRLNAQQVQFENDRKLGRQRVIDPSQQHLTSREDYMMLTAPLSAREKIVKGIKVVPHLDSSKALNMFRLSGSDTLFDQIDKSGKVAQPTDVDPKIRSEHLTAEFRNQFVQKEKRYAEGRFDKDRWQERYDLNTQRLGYRENYLKFNAQEQQKQLQQQGQNNKLTKTDPNQDRKSRLAQQNTPQNLRAPKTSQNSKTTPSSPQPHPSERSHGQNMKNYVHQHHDPDLPLWAAQIMREEEDLPEEQQRQIANSHNFDPMKFNPYVNHLIRPVEDKLPNPFTYISHKVDQARKFGENLQALYQKEQAEKQKQLEEARKDVDYRPSQEELFKQDYQWQKGMHERQRIKNLQDMHIITQDPYDEVRAYPGLDALTREGMKARGSMTPYSEGEDPEFEQYGPYGPLGPFGNIDNEDEEGPYKRK